MGIAKEESLGLVLGPKALTEGGKALFWSLRAGTCNSLVGHHRQFSWIRAQSRVLRKGMVTCILR